MSTPDGTISSSPLQTALYHGDSPDGLFTAVYGLFWFLGSAPIGIAYDHSLAGTAGVSLALEPAVPFFVAAQFQFRD